MKVVTKNMTRMVSPSPGNSFILLFVDGNIGSGKSTFVETFKADLKFLEPVEKWTPYLAKLYSENVTHANVIEFQHVVAAHYEDVLTRLESAVLKAPKERWTVAVVERNPMSGLYVFGAKAKDSSLPGFQPWLIPILETRYKLMEKRLERLQRHPFRARVISLFLDPPTSFCVNNVLTRMDPNGSAIVKGNFLGMLKDLYSTEYATTFVEDKSMQKTSGFVVRVDSARYSPNSLCELVQGVFEITL